MLASRDSVDNAVSSSLLRGVQNVLQDDSLAELHDNSIAISKKVKVNRTYCMLRNFWVPHGGNFSRGGGGGEGGGGNSGEFGE